MSPRKASILFVATTTAVIASCDTMYGLDRKSVLQTMPDIACIRSSIKATPGVLEVQEHSDAAQRQYAFRYRGAPGSRVIGVLQVGPSAGGDDIVMRNGTTDINIVPPAEDIKATRPVMVEMERLIAARCGVLAADMIEHCNGPSCSAED